MSRRLASEFLKQTNLHIQKYCDCCASYTRKKPQQACAQYFVSGSTLFKTLALLTEPLLNVGNRNPQIIESIRVPIQKCIKNLIFKLRQFYNFAMLFFY